MACEESSASVGSVMVQLDSDDLLEEVRQGMQSMWRTKKYSDFTIITRNGKIKTHKFVLASHMKYFNESSKRLEQASVTLDLEPETVHAVLIFLYEGKVEVLKDNLKTLNDAARLLGVELLRKLCAYELLVEDEVTTDNCLTIWEAAVDVKQEARATQALKVALRNFHSVQGMPGFLSLHPELVAQYLGHPELTVSSPAERLGAATEWMMHEPEDSKLHVDSVLQALPLHLMQKWQLRQTLALPPVKANTQASACIHAAMAGTTPPQASTDSQHLLSLPETCLIYGGEITVTVNRNPYFVDKRFNAPARHLSVVWLQRNMEARLLLKNTAEIADAALCCDDDSVYMGGLGESSTDIWKFDSRCKTCTKVGSLTVSRRGHAMCIQNGLVYVFGGRDVVGREKVEVFKPNDGSSSSSVVGRLAFSHLPQGSHRLVCCPVPASKHILVYGASYSNQNGVHPTLHTLQLYDTEKNETSHWIRLPASTGKSAYRVLAVDKAHFILVAEDYTAVCSMKTLLAGGYDKGTVCKHFTVPNRRCAAVLSHDKECVILLGGESKNKSSHVLYAAHVRDISSDNPVGWEKMAARWPKQETLIDTYDTASWTHAIIHK